MNKKYVALVLIIILVIIGGIALALNHTNKQVSSTTEAQKESSTKQLALKFSDLQASYPQNPAACLTTSDDASLKLEAIDQANIVNAVMGTVIDIPAGTNVDIHVKTYDKAVATGTSIYESTYGSYNFTARKVPASSSDKESWAVYKFEACIK